MKVFIAHTLQIHAECGLTLEIMCEYMLKEGVVEVVRFRRGSIMRFLQNRFQASFSLLEWRFMILPRCGTFTVTRLSPFSTSVSLWSVSAWTVNGRRLMRAPVLNILLV